MHHPPRPVSPPASSKPEAFPGLPDTPGPRNGDSAGALIPGIETRQAASDSISSKLRRASKTFEDSDVPSGFLAATGRIASSIASGTASPGSPVVDRKNENRLLSSSPIEDPRTAIPKSLDEAVSSDAARRECPGGAASTSAGSNANGKTGPYKNGYHFPPSHPWKVSLRNRAVAFWHYVQTPLGVFVVLYGLLVVAWGGMLFLLLCNAAPAMCYPTCDHINSPRRKWIEYDSQIVNALFCVTGFGLAPWRFRDLYFLLQYRIRHSPMAIRRLAGIHRAWFRLVNSQLLPPDIGPANIHSSTLARSLPGIPYPEKSIPSPPLTGIRAPPTPTWKLDFVVWCFVANTFLQCCLSGFMWGMNRYNRPSWAVGLFVGLAMVAASLAGIVIFLEGKAVKSVEGVPVSQQDLERLARDEERGVQHYNNIKDKKPTNGKIVGAIGQSGFMRKLMYLVRPSQRNREDERV